MVVTQPSCTRKSRPKAASYFYPALLLLRDREIRLTGGRSSVGLDYDLASHRPGRHISRDLAVGVHCEVSRRHPAKCDFRGLRESGSGNRHWRSNRTAGRLEANKRRLDFECLDTGQDGRACRHRDRSGQSSGWDGGGDEGLAAELDGRSLHAAELHHGGTAEGLAQDADIGALLARAGYQTDERFCADVQTEELTPVNRAALLKQSVKNPVRILDQRPVREHAGREDEFLQNGQLAAGREPEEVLKPTDEHPVEIAIRRLQQWRCRIGRVIRAGIKAVENFQRARGSHLEERPVAVRAAILGVSVEVAVLPQDDAASWLSPVGIASEGVENG